MRRSNQLLQRGIRPTRLVQSHKQKPQAPGKTGPTPCNNWRVRWSSSTLPSKNCKRTTPRMQARFRKLLEVWVTSTCDWEVAVGCFRSRCEASFPDWLFFSMADNLRRAARPSTLRLDPLSCEDQGPSPAFQESALGKVLPRFQHLLVLPQTQLCNGDTFRPFADRSEAASLAFNFPMVEARRPHPGERLHGCGRVVAHHLPNANCLVACPEPSCAWSAAAYCTNPTQLRCSCNRPSSREFLQGAVHPRLLLPSHCDWARTVYLT